MYTIVAFGNTPIPQAYATITVATGTASNFTTIPQAGGGVYDSLGTDQARTQGMIIQATARITAVPTQAALETQERLLRTMLGTIGQLWRKWDDSGLLEWCWARCTSVGNQRAPGNLNYMDLPMSWQMESMAWYDTTDGGFIDKYPLDECFLLRGVEDELLSYPVYYNVTNGSTPQPDITFSITAVAGAVTAVTITNITTGHVLTWAGTLAAGKVLVIDCGNDSVLNNGVDDYASLTPPTNKDEWMLLNPGLNSISVSITEAGTQSTIQFAFYPAEA